MTIRLATLDDLDALAPLFDLYRQFYGQKSDLPLARTFLGDRIVQHQSTILAAFDAGQRPLGFAQLFPSFSSIHAAPVFILSDLFVSPTDRRSGVASALLRAAADFGRKAHAVQLELSTAVSNFSAQALYEGEGWQRDREFFVYTLALT